MGALISNANANANATATSDINANANAKMDRQQAIESIHLQLADATLKFIEIHCEKSTSAGIYVHVDELYSALESFMCENGLQAELEIYETIKGPILLRDMKIPGHMWSGIYPSGDSKYRVFVGIRLKSWP